MGYRFMLRLRLGLVAHEIRRELRTQGSVKALGKAMLNLGLGLKLGLWLWIGLMIYNLG